jgi:hypothetical protein
LTVRIDRKTGEFGLDEVKFGPNFQEGELINSELGTIAKKIRSSGTRRYYEVWKQINSELELGLTLGFIPDGALQRISAKFLKTGMRSMEWSKALEDEIKTFHDKWLREQLGDPPYQFHWGKVISAIDQHGYSANVVIDYTRTK